PVTTLLLDQRAVALGQGPECPVVENANSDDTVGVVGEAAPAPVERAIAAAHDLSLHLIASPPAFVPSWSLVIIGLLHTEIALQLLPVLPQRRIGDHVDNPPVLDHIVAVGHRGGEAKVLLDKQDGKSALA